MFKRILSSIAAIVAAAVVPLGMSVVAAPSASASTTHSCSTGGYSYQTDSMYVVQSWDSTSGNYKYVVTRTANHTSYDSSNHSYTHTATNLWAYPSSSTIWTYTNPANSVTIHSSSAYTDFRMQFRISVDGGTHVNYTSCDVNF